MKQAFSEGESVQFFFIYRFHVKVMKHYALAKSGSEERHSFPVQER